jgi:hypothetical protein
MDPISEKYLSMIDPISWRRDLNINPISICIGLNRHIELNEVYHVRDITSYPTNDENEQEKIHKILEIPKIQHSTNHYLGSGSVDINHFLWEHHKHGSPIPNHIKNHIKAIDSDMKDRILLDHPIKLYSGLIESPASISAMHWNSTRPKKIIHIPSYISTSTDFNTAARFTQNDEKSEHHESDHHGIVMSHARHVIELNFPKMIHNAASVKNHSGANEDEVLLGRDHEFELHPRPYKIEGYADPVYLWKAYHAPCQKLKKEIK